MKKKQGSSQSKEDIVKREQRYESIAYLHECKQLISSGVMKYSFIECNNYLGGDDAVVLKAHEECSQEPLR